MTQELTFIPRKIIDVSLVGNIWCCLLTYTDHIIGLYLQANHQDQHQCAYFKPNPSLLWWCFCWGIGHLDLLFSYFCFVYVRLRRKQLIDFTMNHIPTTMQVIHFHVFKSYNGCSLISYSLLSLKTLAINLILNNYILMGLFGLFAINTNLESVILFRQVYTNWKLLTNWIHE